MTDPATVTPLRAAGRDTAAGTAEAPPTETITDAFERTAREHAAREALSDGETTLTYAELDALGNQIARVLHGRGLAPGEIVGAHFDRGLATYQVFLGALKAGLVVFPLNPRHPADHKSRMCRIAGPSLTVTGTTAADGIPAGTRLPLADLLSAAATASSEPVRCGTTADAPAFVLFSSGSTGEPKGVLLAHRGIAQLSGQLAGFTPGPEDRFLQLAQPTFAASTTDTWSCLLRGGRLTVAPQDMPPLGDLARLVAHERISVLHLPVDLFNLLVEHHPEAVARVRRVLVSGDFPSARHIGRALDVMDGGDLFNAFGCTENSTLTAVHRVIPEDLSTAEIPIGRPLPGVEMTVRTETLEECPPGEIGELCIAGHGLALGYHGDPGLTERKFVRHEGRRLLRTGDLAKLTGDGEIVLAGRTDQMVKVRGFRVEPRHVEMAAETVPGVERAVVLAVPSDGAADRLALWCVPEPGHELAEGELLTDLRERLPDYMVPSAVLVLDAFPLNANGKIDRRQLSSRLAVRGSGRSRGDTRRDRLTDVVTSTLADVRDGEEIGPDDGLLESGVTSLHLIDLGARLEDVVGVALAPDEIAAAGTARGVAGLIRTKRGRD
ncbi:non-ribosomal peptide synthetase [Streptomyces albus subsp. chlorinus]|uniref:non-ribosomal peptide synthetase n=1 Tax=Streptomyces albus TaxID=1888 RepID=UPI00156DFFE5|nr:non-ribosomal peptide synthetase [Streptomyces albus]NSC25608.1 non-ribosomal peptide synthetase [Streptomyces albus subsp. chlorinus]